MIEIQNLYKSLDGKSILHDLTCQIETGSIYGLLGANGAGKSTLLNLMAGIYKPDKGKILYDGSPVFENNQIKHNIAYISDDPFYFSHYTLTDMANYYDLVLPTFSMVKYEELSSYFPIDRNQKINAFSKGMKRQVAIILALSQSPKYILCDESFDGLDPVLRQLVKRIFVEEVENKKTTVVITSHNLSEMENLCDYIGIVHNQKIAVEKSIDTIKEDLHKVQIAFKPMPDPSIFHDIVEVEKILVRGNIAELIVKGNIEDIVLKLESLHPLLVDVLDLSLEEIFIHEMEVNGYDFSNIIL